MKIHHQPLQALIRELFLANQSSDTEADLIAQHLVTSNLVGHESHGVIRAPIYIEWLKNEMVFANRSLEIIHDQDALALVDGRMGYGHALGKQVVDMGVEKCRRHGAAAIALRNSGHLGRIGHWAEIAADAGCVSLHFVNSTGRGMMVVPAGGVEPRLSVNPVTMGVPLPGHPHIVLDIAAAATAEGKLKVARNKGEKVPDNWIVDGHGNPTNDPEQFYGPPKGAILPTGGHKGYGLCFMVEMLAGLLTGGGCSKPGVTRLEQGMLSVFIDPSQLPLDQFLSEESARYIAWVKSARTAAPDGEIFVPGEIEYRRRRQQMNEGIQLDETTWMQLTEAARNNGLSEELISAAIV